MSLLRLLPALAALLFVRTVASTMDLSCTYAVVYPTTVYAIADIFGVTLDKMIAANPWALTSQPHIGQIVRIPLPGCPLSGNLPAAPLPFQCTYTITASATLAELAVSLGFTLMDMIISNPMVPTPYSVLHPGQQIFVPVAGCQPEQPDESDSSSSNNSPAESAGGSTGGGPAGSTTTSPCNYLVLPGDSLTSVAQKFDIPLSSIITANPTTLGVPLVPGQVVNIPASWCSAGLSHSAAATGGYGGVGDGYSVTASEPACVVTVQQGDTLDSLSSRFGVHSADILAANAQTVQPGSLLEAGQRVIIPHVAC